MIEKLRAFLTDQGALLDAVRTKTVQDVSKLIERGRQIADSLQSSQMTTVKTTLMMLLTRVEVGSSCIDIRVSRAWFGGSACRTDPDLAKPRGGETKSTADVLTFKVPARLKRVGREMRMLVENAADRTPADRGLLRIVSRAHDVQLRLTQNVDLTVHDVAREEHVSAAYIYSILRLSSLAPDIVSAIVNGRNPPQLTAKKLMRLSPHLPIDWTEQRKLLGFSLRLAVLIRKHARVRNTSRAISHAQLQQKSKPLNAPLEIFAHVVPRSRAPNRLRQLRRAKSPQIRGENGDTNKLL